MELIVNVLNEKYLAGELAGSQLLAFDSLKFFCFLSLLKNDLTRKRMTALDVGNEVGGLIFGGTKPGRFACTRRDNQIPAGWNKNTRFQFDDHEAAISREGPDDAYPLECLGPGWWLRVMQEREAQRQIPSPFRPDGLGCRYGSIMLVMGQQGASREKQQHP